MSIHINITCDHGGHGICRTAIGAGFDSLAETFGDVGAALRALGWRVETTGDARQTRCLCPEHARLADARAGDDPSEAELDTDAVVAALIASDTPPPRARRPAPLRPAEEIAREMVGAAEIEDGVRWVATILGIQAYATPGDAEDARGILARLIEQSRAEGAAAEMGRRVEPTAEAARKVTAEEWATGARQCGCAHHDREECRRHAAELVCPCGCECHLRTADPEQPRDLAVRIRALVAAHVTRLLDVRERIKDAYAVELEDARDALLDVVEVLLDASIEAECGNAVAIASIIEDMRDDTYSEEAVAIFRRAADELEAAVRECGSPEKGDAR